MVEICPKGSVITMNTKSSRPFKRHRLSNLIFKI